MRITGLEAQNIGPFEDLKVDFKEKVIKDKAEIHILTGENGTGKSTILMLLSVLADNQNDELIILRFKSTKFEHSVLDYGLYSRFDIYFNKNDRFQSFFQFSRNNIGIINYDFRKKIDRQFLNDYNNPSTIFFAYSGYRLFKGDGLVNIKEITTNPIEKAISFEKEIDTSLILNWVANVTTKSLISKNENHRIALNEIEKALSDITGKKIEFDLDETLKVSLKVNDIPLSFNTLPDGLKSIISWLSDLLMRLDRINWADKTKSILEQNFILFLDEIEVHLHPSWQRKILPVVQDLFPNAQIFISTHSPFVVGSVDGAWVYKFKLDENNNSVLDIVYESQDGHSYQYYLRTGFDIDSDFGINVKKDLDKFYDLRSLIISGEKKHYEAFINLAKELAKQSYELESIVGSEVRQVEKIMKQYQVAA